MSIYKNQEYPEKLLQINNLKKKLADNNDLHDQERENLIEIIKSEHNRIVQHQQEVIKEVTDNVSLVSGLKTILLIFLNKKKRDLKNQLNQQILFY